MDSFWYPVLGTKKRWGLINNHHQRRYWRVKDLNLHGLRGWFIVGRFWPCSNYNLINILSTSVTSEGREVLMVWEVQIRLCSKLDQWTDIIYSFKGQTSLTTRFPMTMTSMKTRMQSGWPATSMQSHMVSIHSPHSTLKTMRKEWKKSFMCHRGRAQSFEILQTQSWKKGRDSLK